MVTYSYSVKNSGPSNNIQSVINRIVNELSSNPIIERDIEILIDKGTYSGFKIPDASLYPLYLHGYNLVIKSSGNHFPIIDFNRSLDTQIVGIDIGSGNPNVVIERLRVQYFAVGIRAALNSHYPAVKNCIINNNRNAGIFFEQVIEPQALQNVIVNGDYGIVCRLTKSAALIHNTIFMNGAISTEVGKSISCIWAELAIDYGGGLDDTGVLHLIGNIGWNTSGRCLTLFIADVEAEDKLVANYNDWVVGDPDQFIVVEDNVFYKGPNSSPRRIFKSLAEWKALGHDLNSKSEDPKFISPVKIRKNRNGYAIDLNILPVSPILGMVPSLGFDIDQALEWLPSYVDSADLSKDILKFNRNQSGTAAGANEKLSTSGFFGQDVFSNPLDLDLVKNCNVDPFANILFKSLELWHPTLKPGYFYSNEREYYLYSKKETKTIGELSVTSFFLPGKLAQNKPIKVKVGGKLIDSSYYDASNNVFILYHKDLPITTREEELEIEASVSTWSNNSFTYSPCLYRLKINDGTTKYFLPNTYFASGPVVITDDISYPTDSDYTSNREFAVSFDKIENKSEIVFANNTNQISNGQFDYSIESAPTYWQSSGAEVKQASAPYYSVAGSNICSLSDNGYIRKIVPLTEDQNHCFSFHAMSFGSGTVNWDIEYYSNTYDLLGVINSGQLQLKNIWSRYSIPFIVTGIEDGFTPQVPHPCIELQAYTPPTNCAYASIRLKHKENPAYTGEALIDAVQYEHASFPSLYHRRPFLNELTVEYESSDSNQFIDTRLSIAPIINLMSDGFLFIPEVPASCYNGPTSPAITTLHEWKWPEGRKKLIPWARTKGKDKLRKRPIGKFNVLPEIKPEIIAPVGFTPAVKDIDIYPTIPTTFAGDSNGVGISIKVTDMDGNPHALNSLTASISDFNLRYPGLLSKKIYGLKQQLGASISAKTDSSGTVTLTWIPPEESYGVYKGPIPTPTMVSDNGSRISVITTDYPVSMEALGNVLIFDSLNRPISIKSDTLDSADYIPTYGGEYAVVKLRYPIVPGSVLLKIDNKIYTENQLNILESDQFFVDYEGQTITVKGRPSEIFVQYLPSYVYVSEVDPYKIMLYYDKLFSTYEGNITVSYDFYIKLSVKVHDPANSDYFTKDFELVVQNPLINNQSSINTLSLEF